MQTQTNGSTPDHTPRTGPGRAVIALLLALVGVWAVPTLAQQTIPSETVRKVTAPSPPEEAQIKAVVDQLVPDLSAADPAKIKKARQSLLEPLMDGGISAPFRLAYSQALEAALTQLSADKRDIVAINALIIAGELATDKGLAIVEKQLNNPDAVIRYTAARALGQTLEAVDRAAPAIIADRAERVISTLGKQIEGEKDLRVVDTLARGFVAAMNLSRNEPGWPALRARAVSELCKKFGDRLHGAPDHNGASMLLDTAVTSGFAVRGALGGGNNAPRLPDEARTDAARLAGDVLHFVRRTILASKDFGPVQPDDDQAVRAAKVQARELSARVAGLGEAIVGLTVDGYRDQGLADHVKKATNNDDALFLNGVDQALDALVKQYNFPRDRWVPR